MVSFHFMMSDPSVHAKGGEARGQNQEFLHTLFFNCLLFLLFIMIGPCGRILPQWLRVPCNGSDPATSTQHADGRILG